MDNINLQKINSEERYNFTILDNEIFFDNRLNIYQKHLLWFFNIVSINKDYNHYSIKKIALITKMSKDTIIRNIPTLIELGYIEKIQKKLQNGFNQNYYFLKPIKKVDFKSLINEYNTVSHSDTTQSLTDTVYSRSQQPHTVAHSDINNINYNNINKEECNEHTPIDDSCYDITTNTYTEISDEDKKWNEFCRELCRISSKYNGGTPIEVRSIPTFNYKHNDNYRKLIELYKTCKYDILKCVALAEKEADSSSIKFRWKDFMKCLGLYAKNGYQTENKTETNNYSHIPSYNKIMQAEAERKAKAEIEFKQQAKDLGITEKELEEKYYDEYLQSTAFLRVGKQVEEENIKTKNIDKKITEGFDIEGSYNAYNGDFKGFLSDNIDNIAPDIKKPLKRNTEANIKAMQLGIKYLNEK